MTNFLLIFCCLGVGIVLQHKADINAKTMSHALNQYVIFVALPALALAAGFAPELAAALVGWGIVLSFFTLTGVYFFL